MSAKKIGIAIAALAAVVGVGYAAVGLADNSDPVTSDAAAVSGAEVVDISSGLSEEELAALTPEDRGLLYIIYDSSNSMWGELGDQSRKYEAGRNALTSLLSSSLERDRIAFRAYGHRRPGDCSDTQLIVPSSAPEDAGPQITQAMEGMRPTGKTPISQSLRAALEDFGDDKGDILLISDGIETCDIDPCALMEEWRDKGVSIRVHVVGVGLNEMERTAMSCVADISGGTYFDAGSEEELVEALNTATAIAPAGPSDDEEVLDYVIELRGTDKEGRSYVLAGELLQGENEVQDVTSVGRNAVKQAGNYTVSAGVILQDGSIYKPVTAPVTLDERGEVVVVDLEVTRPAIVSAKFAEDGQSARGDNVEAYQGGKKAFEFRAFDEALARPGQYEFRSNPNQDNQLKVTETLAEGVHTVVDFDLQKTVTFKIVFRQPDGTEVRRNSTLSRGGKTIYSVHANNGGRAIPGTYQLQMDDPKMPLPNPVNVMVQTEGQEIVVDLPAAFLTISYSGGEDDFLIAPDRAFVSRYDEAADSWGARTYTNIDTPVSFAPGRYRVTPYARAGYFDPLEITVGNGERKAISLVAKPLGKVVLRYSANANVTRTPDRAAIRPLDGQVLVGCNCSLDTELKVPPGRYRAEGWRAAGQFTPQEITVRAGETVTVTITN